jgi:ferredoxin--NADP+ reductase
VATDEFEDLPVDLVFRSVGYHGVPLEGLPFDERSGTVPNEQGSVTTQEGSMVGLYVAGWIKRGPSGVIGTNKPDASETVRRMLEDVAGGATLDPDDPQRDTAMSFVMQRQPDLVTYDDWRRIDELETAAGEESGRPRVKFTNAEDILAALRG